MTTGSKFAYITHKKLLGFTDFDSYLLRYLRTGVQDAVKRLFVQGSFDEAMPLSGPSANVVQIDLKPTLSDGFVHDGAGHILDLAELLYRSAFFQNTAAQVYEVGAGYVEYPEGIRINPRTGQPEYDHFVEGVGVEAVADLVTVNEASLTFVVDSLFESGVAVGVHTDRQVRVFRKDTPGDIGTSEAVAIETALVFYGGGMNQITTTGLLGQTSASADASDYVIQLIGISVLKTEADNAPSQVPDAMFFAGTVTGNGGTPTVFDTSGQRVIQSQSANMIDVAPLSAWADGTTNPADDLQAVLAKFVTDLTSTTGLRGAGKLTAPARPSWYDGTTNVAANLDAALAKIVTDLTSVTGEQGAGKVSAPAIAGAPYSAIDGSIGTTLTTILNAVNDSHARRVLDCLRDVRLVDTAVSKNMRAVALYAGQIVMVGDNGAILTSADGGHAWTARTPGSSFTGAFYGIQWQAAHNVWVAVGEAGEIQTSPDGITWTRRHTGGNDLKAVANSGVQIVVVGDSACFTSTAPTTTWLTGGALPGANYDAIVFYGAVFVATGKTGNPATSLAHSTNGAAWTAVNTGIYNVDSIAIGFVPGLFDKGMIVAGRDVFGDPVVCHSVDGIVYSSVSIGGGIDAPITVVFTGDGFVVFSPHTSNSVIYTSADGASGFVQAPDQFFCDIPQSTQFVVLMDQSVGGLQPCVAFAPALNTANVRGYYRSRMWTTPGT